LNGIDAKPTIGELSYFYYGMDLTILVSGMGIFTLRHIMIFEFSEANKFSNPKEFSIPPKCGYSTSCKVAFLLVLSKLS